MLPQTSEWIQRLYLVSLQASDQLGLVLMKSHPSRRTFRKFTIGIEMMILHLVLRRPGIYLHEIARELEETLGAEIALSTICMFLKKCGFTWQKLRISALQRDSFLCLQFTSEMSLYDRDMIFLYETGSDRHNSITKYSMATASGEGLWLVRNC